MTSPLKLLKLQNFLVKLKTTPLTKITHIAIEFTIRLLYTSNSDFLDFSNRNETFNAMLNIIPRASILLLS